MYRRRCQYDAFELEQERLQQLQLKRIRLEEGSVHPMIGDTDSGRGNPEGGEASRVDTGDLFEAATAVEAAEEEEAAVDLDELLEDFIGGPIKTIVDSVGAQGGGGGRGGGGDGGGKVGSAGVSDKHKSAAIREKSVTVNPDDAVVVVDDAHKTCSSSSSSSMNSDYSSSSTMNGVLPKNGAANETRDITMQPIVSNAFVVHEGGDTTIQPKVKVEVVLKKRKFVIA